MATSAEARLRLVASSGRGRQRVDARIGRLELGGGCVSTIEKLVGRLRAEPPSGVRDPIETLLDRLDPCGVGLERRDEPVQVTADLLQAVGEITELADRELELGCERDERRERTLGDSRERRSAVAVVGSDGHRGGGCAGREIGRMAHPLALGAQRLLLATLDAVGALDEVTKSREARLLGSGVAQDRVRALARCRQGAPCLPRVAPARGLLLAEERIEDIELIRGPGEPSLLELPRHRDQPLGRGGEVLTRNRTSPRVRPRTPVCEDATGENDPPLVLRPELEERVELAVVEEPVSHVELAPRRTPPSPQARRPPPHP